MRPMVEPGYFDISPSELDAVKSAVARYGVVVKEDWNEPEGGRFIGTIDGKTITLFPKYDHPFALYFTVAHLYGHLVQMVRGGDRFREAVDLIYKVGHVFTPREVQELYAFEIEAAEIGRRLIGEIGPVSRELDGQYARYFFADFHYLVHFLETKEQGAALFERFLRREPVPWRTIEPDARPLEDCSSLVATGAGDVVVI
jgi:hypothetical protein